MPVHPGQDWLVQHQHLLPARLKRPGSDRTEPNASSYVHTYMHACSIIQAYAHSLIEMPPPSRMEWGRYNQATCSWGHTWRSAGEASE
jgi:hypothetical protein